MPTLVANPGRVTPGGRPNGSVMESALHPNLAQLAASYDDICSQVEMGLLPPADARTAIMALVARDDAGVQWCISPADGLWYRRTRTGELVADTPPRSGIQTPSGWDVSSSTAALGDPRHRIYTREVDPLQYRSPTDLVGSTIAGAVTPTRRGATGRFRFGPQATRRVVALVAVLLLAAAAWLFFESSGEPNPTPPPPVLDGPLVTDPVPEIPAELQSPGG